MAMIASHVFAGASMLAPRVVLQWLSVIRQACSLKSQAWNPTSRHCRCLGGEHRQQTDISIQCTMHPLCQKWPAVP